MESVPVAADSVIKFPATSSPEEQPSPHEQNKGDDDIEGTAGFISCSVNLLKAVIGAGILAIPNAISCLGWVPGLLILIFAATLASFGLFLLTIVGHWHGRKSTFGSVAEKTFPRAAILFDLTVAVKCLGVATAYLGNICNQIPNIIKDIMIYQGKIGENDPLPAWMTQYKVIWVSISLLLLSPIVSFRKIDSLKYSSFFGMFSVFYLMVLSIYSFVTVTVEGKGQASIKAFGTFDSKSLSSFAIFVFAFNCHQNVFPIQNEARKNSPQWMTRVILTVMILTLLIYFTFGLFSYGTFPDIKDDILLSYPPGKMQFIIAKILFVVLLSCSYPLQSFPCRMAMERMAASLMPNISKRRPLIVYWGSTLLIVSLTGLVASLDMGFGLILKIIGSTAGPVICFFFPALLYLKETSQGQTKGKPWIRNAAKALLVVSFITTGMSLILVVMNLVKKK